MSPDRRKPLLCRLNLLHSWVMKIGEGGERYRQCKRCGKDKYDPPPTPGDSIG